MPLQTSGQISFADLQSHLGGSHPITMGEYAAYRVSGSGDTISMNQFHGATLPFDFTTSSPRTLPSGFMTIRSYDAAQTLVQGRSKITLSFNSSNITASGQDYTYSATASSNASSHTVPTVNYSNTSDIASVQARWVISKGYVAFSGGTSDEYLRSYINGTNQTVRTGNQGNNTNLYFTGTWRTITPSRFGGSSSNSQVHEIITQADAATYVTDSVYFKLNSGGYIELQVKVNRSSGGSKTMSYRKSYSSGNEPFIYSTSYQLNDDDDDDADE